MSDSSSTLNPSDPRWRRRARRARRRPVLPLRRGRRRASRRSLRALRRAPAAAAVKRATTRAASSATGRTLRRTPTPAPSCAASSAAGRALRAGSSLPWPPILPLRLRASRACCPRRRAVDGGAALGRTETGRRRAVATSPRSRVVAGATGPRQGRARRAIDGGAALGGRWLMEARCGSRRRVLILL